MRNRKIISRHILPIRFGNAGHKTGVCKVAGAITPPSIRASVVIKNLLFALVCCLPFLACDGGNTPLDAGTRQAIDSLAAANIRLANVELDSLCKLQHNIVLPRLVDSIRQKRLQEIQKQLKTVPR